MRKMRIAIIGGGINGLGVGVNILETIPNAFVTIFTENISPNTTGDVAAGLFRPYAVAGSDPRMKKWLELTYEYITNLISTDPNHHGYGLFYQDIYEISETEPLKMDLFHDIIDSSRFMTAKELGKFPQAKFGIASTTVIIQTTLFLSHLYQKFIALGGKIVFQRIESFDDVQSRENYPLVINCTGLGSRKLCNDPNIYPVRGQVVRVKAPWIKYTIFNQKHYIIPQSDGTVVLGGTTQKDNWNLEPDEIDTEFILNGCSNILIGLKNPEIVAIQVGLRPGASTIRLESEKRENESTGQKYSIIHNYGHGGSGFTLFWGCSVDVVELAKEILIA